MKNKKALKGMTLVEIIISLAIFALLGLVLVQVGSLIDNSNRATNKLKKRITVQSPYAASRTVDYTDYDDDGNPVPSQLTPEAMEITVSLDDSSGNPKNVTVKCKKSYDSDEYESKTVAAVATITANRYNTIEIVEDNSNIYDPHGANAGNNLKFAVIEEDLYLTAMTFDMSTDSSPKTITSTGAYVLPQMDKWESTDSNVATVDSNGKVTPVGAGTCQIIGVKKGVRYITVVTVV